MNISLHMMEPWLIENQFVEYNLGESGVVDITLGEVLSITNTNVSELLECSFKNNDTYGSYSLRSKIASLYNNVEPDEVIVTTGVSEALFIYYHLRFEPGANVIVPFPAFQTLYEVPRYLGYEVRHLELYAEENYRVDLERLSSLIDNKTKVIVLNNPHNPTGMTLSNSEFKAIINLAKQHDIEILVDEHYRFIPYDDETLLPSLYNKSNRIVAMGSMIKCFACVGLRIGWVVAERSLIKQMRDFKDYTTHSICSVNDFLAYRLLLHNNEIGLKNKSLVLQNVNEFRKFVKMHNSIIDWVEPQAGLVAFPYFKDKTENTQRFAERLVKETEVSVLPGEVFERPGYFRVGFGLPPAKFSQAVKKMSNFITSNYLK
ncbi:guanitoxin biosynthesis PLP-dependent (S)-gamma-hydroxy-L-arginine cyclodehydratase GntC [Paenibacillus gansuensis]|uniref:Guanitoxin biosynthesis PLP-dependent (S)-gamma-hydroxy-L-arginine cyclodehydratase GntC n=1 Tax=Paenibacillus gansuensis TaxID=306542 RepID=A0ABW5PHI8_9BACL